MRSSVPYFKTALLARLKAATALQGPDILVSWGNPYPDDAPGQLVAVGSAHDRSREFVAGMSQARETYAVDVLVSVVDAPENPIADREVRAYELADAVDESVRAWNLMGGPLVSGDWGQVSAAVPGESSDGDALITGSERESLIKLTLNVTARV